MKATILLLLAALASAPPAKGSQEVFHEERTRVAVSAEDLNVLVAEDGEITSAVANESELRLVHRDGRLYFRALAQGKPIPLFVEVKREGGSARLYTLLLEPLAELSAERIVIRNAEPEDGEPDRKTAPSRPAEPRVREIKRLLLAMARDWEIDGYRIQAGEYGIVSTPSSGARRELLSSYIGPDLRGEIWLVRNIGAEQLTLDAPLDSKIVAVASELPEIAPEEEARMYLVRTTNSAGNW